MLNVALSFTPESFDFIYLDPPFFTGKEQVGTKENLRYQDSWDNDIDVYISWLEERIRVLKPLLKKTATFVLHLDRHAVHYAKVMMDSVFGREFFRNEIIWHYTGGGRSKSHFSRKHDNLLCYSLSDKPYFNLDAIRVPYKKTSGYAKSGIRAKSGKLYLPHPDGTPLDDVWSIPIVNPMSAERTGYPTQKPLLLLERLIAAYTPEKGFVGDFCCGSGTTLAAAEKLGRRWFGCDISEEAVAFSRKRLGLID